MRWYHTIELPGGVVTPGRFDTRHALRRVPLPGSLQGKRCLDVGTSDGFWAFEMERRGASEVVAIDVDESGRLDWPASVPERDRWGDPGRARQAFAIAAEALGSSVKRVDLSVYELSPDVLGSFDFVFMGSLLLHLRDPVRALAAVASVVRGELLCSEPISLSLTLLRPRWPAAALDARGRPTWWPPNVAGLRRLVEAGGFSVRAMGGPYFVRFGPAFPRPSSFLRPLDASRLPVLALYPFGAPHAWALARPRG